MCVISNVLPSERPAAGATCVVPCATKPIALRAGPAHEKDIPGGLAVPSTPLGPRSPLGFFLPPFLPPLLLHPFPRSLRFCLREHALLVLLRLSCLPPTPKPWTTSLSPDMGASLPGHAHSDTGDHHLLPSCPALPRRGLALGWALSRRAMSGNVPGCVHVWLFSPQVLGRPVRVPLLCHPSLLVSALARHSVSCRWALFLPRVFLTSCAGARLKCPCPFFLAC